MLAQVLQLIFCPCIAGDALYTKETVMYHGFMYDEETLQAPQDTRYDPCLKTQEHQLCFMKWYAFQQWQH